MKPKYQCRSCGYEHIERKTIKQRVLRMFVFFVIGIIALTSLLGTTAFYNFVAGGVYEKPDMVVSIGGLYSSVLNFKSNFKTGDEAELKTIALDITKGYEGDYNKSKAIYDYLVDNFRYEKGTNTNPIEIWYEKEGDCDEMSSLYMHLLKSINIDSMIQANNNHAWVVVKLEDKNILADITSHKWKVFEK